MTGRFAALAAVGWLCLACSVAEFWCVSAQTGYSQAAEVTSISVDRHRDYSEDNPIASCRADSHCTLIETDGSGPDPPPLFLSAVTNDAITTILLTADRYTLKQSYWAQFKDTPYLLKRNLTVLGAVMPYGLLDFSLMERRVLLSTGATVVFRNVVLQNVRKLGGWAVDFFVGETDSQVTLQNVVRVKPACQLPTTTLKSAASFQRVSPAYPPNNITIWDHYCVDAAINGPTVTHNCYDNVLHFDAFSNLAASDDPNLGRQYPGYVLFQENTSRVCQATITQQCLDQHNGDEELCLVMLITATLDQGGGDSIRGRPRGAIAGVAIAASVVLIGLLLLVRYRNHILLWCLRRSGKSLQDMESGGSSKEWVMQHALPLALGHVDGIATDGSSALYHGSSTVSSGQGGRRAISQQVTLGVLLGAGSFGRVYRGRWHSTDVAVKIMTCTPDELRKVLREAEVMMQLNHRNVVRAFHASVWNPQEQARALQARERRVSGNNTTPPTSTTATRQWTSRRPSTGLGVHNSNGLQSQSSGQHLQTRFQHVQTSRQHSQSSIRAATHTATTQQQAEDSTSSRTHDAAEQQHDLSVQNFAPQIPNRSRSSLQNNLPGDREPGVWPNEADTSKEATAQRWYASHTGSQPASITQQPLNLPSVYANGNTGVTGGASAQDSLQQVRSPSTASNAAMSPPGPGSSLSLLNSNSGSGAGPAGGSTVEGFHLGPSNCFQRGPSAIGEARESLGDGQLLSQNPPRQQAPVVSPFAGQQQQEEPDLAPGQHSPAACFADSRPPQQGANGSSGDRSSATLANGSMWPSAPAGTISVAGTISGAASGVSASGHANEMPGMAILHTEPDGYQANSSSSARGISKSPHSDGSQQDGGSRRSWEPGQEIKRVEVQVWIVLELCTGGTLKDAVTAGKLGLSNRIETGKLLSLLLDAAKGMAYLHSKGIMHGDLKAGNVLLQNLHGEGDQVAKISDFGLAAVLMNGATHRSTASMGTITHMAPEVLRNGRVSCAADVYSFAIMLWEVLTNKQAYHGVHYGAVVERVVVQGERPPIQDNVPDGFSILMQTCWDAVPEKRPTFDQIVTCLELLLDNLSDIDSSNASVDSALADGDGPPPAAYRTSSGLLAAAVASHLQQGQKQAATQYPALLGALTPATTASLANVSLASTQQTATPQPGQQHPSMNGISRVPDDSSTQHSTHRESRSLRSVSQGHAVALDMQSALDASPFVQDL